MVLVPKGKEKQGPGGKSFAFVVRSENGFYCLRMAAFGNPGLLRDQRPDIGAPRGNPLTHRHGKSFFSIESPGGRRGGVQPCARCGDDDEVGKKEKSIGVKVKGCAARRSGRVARVRGRLAAMLARSALIATVHLHLFDALIF